MKILILFCGGTIVMQETASGTLNMQSKDDAIAALMNMEPNIHTIADIDVLYIDNIDSANMNAEHWNTIATAVANNYKVYDGFVITHGTNTMAYTSSALSYALQNLGKPVVLTGAQIPGHHIESDARRNFVNAIRVATLDLAGVALVFDEEIILGSRATKVSESKLDAFETVNWDLLGQIRIDLRLHPDRTAKRHNGDLELQIGFEESIAVIHMVPGTSPRIIDQMIELGTRGLVLRGFGPGDIGYQYLDVLHRAKQQKIPVIIDTQCLEGATMMHLNDVGQQALESGVIQAHDMSIESVTTKLMWALKRPDVQYEDIQKIIHTNYTGEINIEGNIY